MKASWLHAREADGGKFTYRAFEVGFEGVTQRVELNRDLWLGHIKLGGFNSLLKLKLGPSGVVLTTFHHCFDECHAADAVFDCGVIFGITRRGFAA